MIINAKTIGVSGGSGRNMKVKVNFCDLRSGLSLGQICIGYKDKDGTKVTFPYTCTIEDLTKLTPIITNDTSVLIEEKLMEINGVDLSPSSNGDGAIYGNGILSDLVLENITCESIYCLCKNVTSLKRVVIEDNCTFSNMEDAFTGCANLIEAPYIPETVTSVSATFSYCRSLVVPPVLPNGVSGMTRTFDTCELLTYPSNIPEAVTELFSTFIGCISLRVPPKIPKGVIALSSTFSGCSALTEGPELPSTLEYISGAFSRCYSLVTPSKIPDSVCSISSIFNSCTSMKVAPDIPSGVGEMSYAFYFCTSLINAPSIPPNATSVSNTYNSCYSLRKCKFEHTTPPRYSYTLDDTRKLEVIYVPSSALSTWQGTYKWKDYKDLMVGY